MTPPGGAGVPAASGGTLGVFDSGLGGLTVVREIQRQLPGESIVYIGDTAHVPYGGRPCEDIRDFSLGIGRYLTHGAGCRAIVVACNTATASAVDALRAHLTVPIVGMEPGVKPAAQATRTGRVAVLATVSTLSADRFAGLIERHARGLEVLTQPCPGLVDCVEAGDLSGPVVQKLVERYVAPLIVQGVDTLVLGCTHYPLLRPLIEAVAGPNVAIIDTGPAVAQQVARVAGTPHETDAHFGALRLLTTGNDAATFGARAQMILSGSSGGAAAAPLPVGRLTWKNGELTDYGDTTS